MVEKKLVFATSSRKKKTCLKIQDCKQRPTGRLYKIIARKSLLLALLTLRRMLTATTCEIQQTIWLS